MAGKGYQKPQKSRSLQQKEQMGQMQQSGDHLNYAGLMEGIFIPPTGTELPSLFKISTLRDRLKVEYQRLIKNAIKNLQSRFMAYWYVTPSLKLEKHKTPGIAKELYEEIYTALAAGDLRPVEKKLNPGFMKSLQSRINQRPQGETLQWKLHKYLEKPKCVAFQFGVPSIHGPNTQRMGIMQAVIRIRSQQSLFHVNRMRIRDPDNPKQFVVADVLVDRQGKAIPEEELPAEEERSKKELIEYFVLERMLVKGEVGKWQAWGMTQETTLEDLKRKEAQRQRALLGEH